MASEASPGLWDTVKHAMRKLVPEVDLDGPGVRVDRTAEGLVVSTDPAAYVKHARRAGFVGALAFGAFALVPNWWVRGPCLVLAVLCLVAGLRAKPRDDRCTIAPEGVTVVKKGATTRTVPARDVERVRHERIEYESGSGDDRRTVVRWLTVLELRNAERWLLASGADRAKARTFAEDAAVALGRPFVDATMGGEEAVAHEAVNLDLVERLRRGLLAAPDPGPAPPGVVTREVDGGVEFATRRRSWGKFAGLVFAGVWFGGIGFAMTAVLVAVALAPEGSPWALVFVPFPLLFGLAGVAFVVFGVGQVTGEAYLQVTREGVAWGTRRLGRERRRQARPEAFEDLRVLKGLVLVSDTREEHLGFDNADAAQQAWLRAAALAALERYA